MKKIIDWANAPPTKREFGLLVAMAIFGVLIFVFVLIMTIGTSFGAEGSAQKDPIFKYSGDISRDNIIVRDANGRRIGYWIKDPILDDNWIQYHFRRDPEPVKKADPIFPRWDLDPVGE